MIKINRFTPCLRVYGRAADLPPIKKRQAVQQNLPTFRVMDIPKRKADRLQLYSKICVKILVMVKIKNRFLRISVTKEDNMILPKHYVKAIIISQVAVWEKISIV